MEGAGRSTLSCTDPYTEGDAVHARLPSLARLLPEQGQRDEVRAMLAEICGRFTEGFDTADLKDSEGPAR